MGSWAYVAGGVVAIILIIFKWYSSKERKKGKEQVADGEALDKAKKSGKAQYLLSYFNRRNRR